MEQLGDNNDIFLAHLVLKPEYYGINWAASWLEMSPASKVLTMYDKRVHFVNHMEGLQLFALSRYWAMDNNVQQSMLP